jgi:hypothetical protein
LSTSAPGLRAFPQTLELRSGEKLSLAVQLNFAGITGDSGNRQPAAKPSSDNVPMNITPAPLSGGRTKADATLKFLFALQGIYR